MSDWQCASCKTRNYRFEQNFCNGCGRKAPWLHGKKEHDFIIDVKEELLKTYNGDVQMAIKAICTSLQQQESPIDTTLDRDEILIDALKEC